MKKIPSRRNGGTPFTKGRINSSGSPFKKGGIMPNFNEEKKLWKKGCKIVVGLDEVGRGPLAGPVCAAAVCTVAPLSLSRKNLRLRDSKQLTAEQREQWYKIFIKHPYIDWGIGLVSEKIIDRINIFQATKLAMKKAILQLEKKINKEHRDCLSRQGGSQNDRCIDFLILDGNFTIQDLNISQKAIVKADEKVFSCAAASIIAKVTRDRLMKRYAKKFPQYGFQYHKGYGTRKHFEAIKKYGPCPLHRKSFAHISMADCLAGD